MLMLRVFQDEFSQFVESTKAGVKALERRWRAPLDPDRVRESLREGLCEFEALLAPAFARIAPSIAPKAERLFHALDQHPWWRAALRAKLIRSFNDHSVDEELTQVQLYVRAVAEAVPISSAASMHVASILHPDFFHAVLQAHALLEQARSRRGEARYESVKRLANIVLFDLYERHIDALVFLETMRTGVVPAIKGRQADSFGAKLREVRRSLLPSFESLVAENAHRYRNQFAHLTRGARLMDDFETIEYQHAELPRESVVSLLDRLEAMLDCVCELQAVLVQDMGHVIARLAVRNITWGGFKAGKDELTPALVPYFERAKPLIERWQEHRKEGLRARGGEN